MKKTGCGRRLRIAGAFLLSVSFLWAKPGDVISKFESPSPCVTGVAWDGTRLWTADRRTAKLYALNPETGTVVRELSSPGWRPTGLAFDGEALWCADEEEKSLYRVDPETGEVLKRVDSPVRSPFGLAWVEGRLYVADLRGGRIVETSPEDGTTIRSFVSPTNSPCGLAFDGTYFWISDRLADEIYLTTKEGETLFVLKAPGPYSTGLAFDGRNVWNADYQEDLVYRLKVEDDERFFRSRPRKASLTFSHVVRNFGPGGINRLDVYFAVPGNRDNQELESAPAFTPEPAGFVTDRWGQKFAHFVYENVPPGEAVTSKMTLTATMYDVTYYVRPEKVSSLSDIPAEIRERFTRDGSKYLIHDPVIRKAVREAVGDEKNPYRIARKIYRYLMDKLYYELAGGWNTAPAVLKRGNGSCSEYSFVYIALARAAGLPARYVGSVVVRGDDASLDDEFHRWVEVYLPPYGWVPVDPSGGDKPSTRAQALRFGHIGNHVLITTQGGGDSRYLGWTYNCAEKLKCEPKTKVRITAFGEWEPVGRRNGGR